MLHHVRYDDTLVAYGEAAVAVNNAVHFLNPKARVNPGHSTNLKVFSQDESEGG